jgi:hypothetical protein
LSEFTDSLLYQDMSLNPQKPANARFARLAGEVRLAASHPANPAVLAIARFCTLCRYSNCGFWWENRLTGLPDFPDAGCRCRIAVTRCQMVVGLKPAETSQNPQWRYFNTLQYQCI